MQLYEQGTLEIDSGFTNIAFDVDSCSLKMEQNDGQITYVDYVVDATNQTTNLNRHPLYGQLIEDGLTLTHSAGGISIELKTHKLLDCNGCPSPVLRAIGPITLGSAYAMKASYSLGDVASAQYIAEQIHDEIAQELTVAIA